jgi:superfamily II DNA or RNA helicase
MAVGEDGAVVEARADLVATADFFAALGFRHEWRKYQNLILELFEQRDPSKRTFHIVAPPGSGKTLVGIEIARRIGRPCVTFSPTTTIQEQWRDKVRLFLPDGADDSPLVAAAVSTDPSRLGAVSSLTYQSLATQTQEREFLDRLGLEAWLRELIEDGGRDTDGARAYVDRIAERAPAVHRREIAKRAIREKRGVLAGGEAGIHELLHPNAIDLIDRIVAGGTGCVILDEAHHLLDYWSLILADLIGRLPDALVVGLTATPPASAEPDELANYLRLVNGIDFEVPTPAVVRDGYLAPYQDLVLLTRPTDRERRFLDEQDRLLHQAIAGMTSDPRFDAWLVGRINRPAGDVGWESLLRDEFDFAVAGVRRLLAGGVVLAEDIELADALRQPPTLDDDLAILRAWSLDVLRLSADPADAERLADLRAVLRTLGMVMTETGWRSAASPLDRVLAYSESKVEGLLDILRTEARAMGERLRVAVITDHERAPALATRRLAEVLDEESGGAVRAIRALVADQATLALNPIMVTGRTVLVAEPWSESFVAHLRAYFAERDLVVELTARAVEPGLVEIDGTGPAWRPRHYVALVTELLERGVTRCIVGTRGLLAEGWDSLALNTLVDLTTAGTFASVNQIRGRSIRLDPREPRKVANNWDVVCYEPELEEGDRDLRRLIGKHGYTWGLGSGDRIVRGVAHVDERIPLLGGRTMTPLPRTGPTAGQINRTALRRAADRVDAYRRWAVGSPYDNFVFNGTVLERPEQALRTSFTFGRSLRALLNLIVVALAYYAVLLVGNGAEVAARAPSPLNLFFLLGLFVLPLVLVSPLVVRYVRAAFIELPVDSNLADFGRAIAEAFRSTGLAPMSPDQVRVRVNEIATYDVVLESRDKEAVDAFATAYHELFAPIVDQRYLVTRDESAISGTFYAPVWYVLRRLFTFARRRRVSYHPVPAAFSRRREMADSFVVAWKRWVGGGELVYTRSSAGMDILLRERVSRHELPRAATIEEWR